MYSFVRIYSLHNYYIAVEALQSCCNVHIYIHVYTNTASVKGSKPTPQAVWPLAHPPGLRRRLRLLRQAGRRGA